MMGCVLILRSAKRVSKDETGIPVRSWFETPLTRLLTMRTINTYNDPP